MFFRDCRHDTHGHGLFVAPAMMLAKITVDAHLDLAYNALRGRNLQLFAVEQSPDEEGIPTVGFEAQALGKLKAIRLLEGADALGTVEDIRPWFDAGLRIVGLAWKRTRRRRGR